MLRDVNLSITQLEKRIDRLCKEVLILIKRHANLDRVFKLLTSVKSIPKPAPSR